MTVSEEILDELLKCVERPEDFFGDTGLMKELKIRLMERMLGAELTAHLGYEEGKEAPPGQRNRRNGASTKVLKGQARIDGMDDKIIGLYAAGLTVRDIQDHLLELYGLKVSPDLITGTALVRGGQQVARTGGCIGGIPAEDLVTSQRAQVSDWQVAVALTGQA